MWFFDPLKPQSFDLVMIDVPWPWKNYTTAFNWRSPEAKYDTMPLDQAAELPVRRLLKPGGVVWAWFTFPMMPEACSIATQCWGLRYQAGGGWGKRTVNGHLRMGNGLVIRGALEGFMILQNGTGGGLRMRSVRNLIETFGDKEVQGVARGHSRKPEEIYDMLKAHTPGWKRADIFSTKRRQGWTSWGKQTGKYTD